MKNIYQKTIKSFALVLFLLISFSFLLIGLAKPANAQTGFPTATGTPSAVDCNNPFSGVYTTQACVELRLGLSDIKSDTIVIPRDPNSVIIVAFRIFLYIVITITVGRIAWVGLQIGGVGDDSDKRKELIMQIIYILFGMVVAIGALSLTYIAQNIFFGKSFDDQIIKCSDLPQNASQELKDKCNKNVSTIPTPTAGTKVCIGDQNSSLRINVPANTPCPSGFH